MRWSKTEDLREFEFCQTPDGRLRIIGAACTINPDGTLCVAYHSSHEKSDPGKKAGIILAKVKINP